MAETICRALRDGAFEGEHAPALTIKDTIDTPLGSFVFNHILTQLTSNVLAGKSQARGVVLVALSRPPSFYAELLKSKGFDISSSSKWLRVLDCYSDPLGWKKKLMERGTVRNPYEETLLKTSLCKNVKELDKVLSSIVELGKEIVEEGKGRFAVAIDSVMLLNVSFGSVS